MSNEQGKKSVRVSERDRGLECCSQLNGKAKIDQRIRRDGDQAERNEKDERDLR